MGKSIGVGILGGTGYGAGELLRLLVAHPEVEVISVTSTSKVGAAVSSVHSHLTGFYDLKFSERLDLERLGKCKHSVVFAALPHGASASGIAELLQHAGAETLKLIDLSGDFRLQSATQRQKHYPEAVASPELRARFVYGLSEINRESIRAASYVANPGCLASACILAARPFAEGGYRGPIVFDAKTGTSGAGRSPSEAMHHPTRHSNSAAYKVLEHRHEPEILQGLGDIEGERIESTFVPHLLPTARGIFATAHLTLDREASTEELRELYRRFYQHSPFVRVRDGSPDLHDVLGSNFCDVSVFARGKQVVCMATLDNLVKGMAGQAIQNLNLMCGLPETSGLWAPALGPC